MSTISENQRKRKASSANFDNDTVEFRNNLAKRIKTVVGLRAEKTTRIQLLERLLEDNQISKIDAILLFQHLPTEEFEKMSKFMFEEQSENNETSATEKLYQIVSNKTNESKPENSEPKAQSVEGSAVSPIDKKSTKASTVKALATKNGDFKVSVKNDDGQVFKIWASKTMTIEQFKKNIDAQGEELTGSGDYDLAFKGKKLVPVSKDKQSQELGFFGIENDKDVVMLSH